MQARRLEWPALKEENLSTQSPTPSENIFENEGEIKSLEEKEKLREDIARRPLFQLEILKEVLQAEGMWNQTEMWVYNEIKSAGNGINGSKI